MKRKKLAIILAIGAALLYAFSTPLSKILLTKLSPMFIAALLYLGAGIGMLLFSVLKRKNKQPSNRIVKKDIPYVILMVVLDIIAPFLLMFGLSLSNASTVSLLNNFEIVATSLIAWLFFKEAVGKRMWIAIVFIVIAGILLSFDDITEFRFSLGSILVLLAAISWGLENNCTRMLSLNDPLKVVVIKGFGSGLGALAIALLFNQVDIQVLYIFIALVLGFFAYGISIYLYIYAQRWLGASRTSAYYALAPFIGVLLSFIILGEQISLVFIIALVVMILGTYLAVSEKHHHLHKHLSVTHTHSHNHSDLHHNHIHEDGFIGEHTHEHTHEELEHEHDHYPDMHHNHKH